MFANLHAPIRYFYRLAISILNTTTGIDQFYAFLMINNACHHFLIGPYIFLTIVSGHEVTWMAAGHHDG